MSLQEEQELIIKDPHNYICDWMENNLICVGRQVFKTLALVPNTLFLPKIPFNSTDIRANINILLIGPPGSGKSTICNKFSKLSYNPFIRRTISEADLSMSLFNMRWATIIIEDFAETIAQYGYGVVKVLEGVSGEEESINKSNMRVDYTGEKIKAVSILGITPHDLIKYAPNLESGLLSRCIVKFIKLKQSDYSKIAKYINLNVGDTKKQKLIELKEKVVKDFYEELRWIQRGKHKEFLKKNKSKLKPISPIKGYDIKLEFREEMLKKWEKITGDMQKNYGINPKTREFQEYYRLLVSSAFLNIHNREIKNGILIPNRKDHEIAIELMLENMKYKFGIPLAIKGNQKANSVEQLENLLNRGLPEYIKDVLLNISPYSKFLEDN